MVDAACGKRIERSLAQQGRDYALDHRAALPEYGADVLDIGGAGGGYAVWGSSHGAPNVSRAFALGIDGAITSGELDRVEAFYAGHGTGVRVSTSPWAHASLFDLLAERRYRVVTFDNVLTRALGPDDDPITAAPGVTVTRITPSPEAVLAWGRVVRVGFDMDADDPRWSAADRVFERSKTASLFLATLDGEPAGGSALDLRDGIATLFGTSTLPVFRRRGVHGALIAARLAHAREAGADLAVVLTSPGSDSQRNLEARRGFRVGYTATVFASAS